MRWLQVLVSDLTVMLVRVPFNIKWNLLYHEEGDERGGIQWPGLVIYRRLQHVVQSEALYAMKRPASIYMEVWENPMDWKIGQTPGMWTTFAASFIQPEVWFGVKSDRKMTSSNDWQWLNETASPQCIRGKNLMPSSFHGMPSKVSSLLSVLSQSILVSEDLDIWWLRGGHREIHQLLWPALIPHTGLRSPAEQD